MKLKLIEAGGFSGLKKTSEADLSGFPEALQEHVESIFSKGVSKPAQARAQGMQRDKENYFIEYNGRALPVSAVQPSKELEALIEKLKLKLQY